MSEFTADWIDWDYWFFELKINDMGENDEIDYYGYARRPDQNLCGEALHKMGIDKYQRQICKELLPDNVVAACIRFADAWKGEYPNKEDVFFYALEIREFWANDWVAPIAWKWFWYHTAMDEIKRYGKCRDDPKFEEVLLPL